MLGCPMDKGFNLLQSQSLPMAMVIDQGESTIWLAIMHYRQPKVAHGNKNFSHIIIESWSFIIELVIM